MSEQFLNQILQVENDASLLREQTDSSGPCCICLRGIGTLVSLLFHNHLLL